MNSSELKTLFTSNHEEAKRKIVCCCSSFNKLCIRKAKDTDLTLFNFDELRIYMQTDKDSLVNVRKIYEKFGSTTCLLWLQFHAITGCVRFVISLMFQNEYYFNEHHQVF